MTRWSCSPLMTAYSVIGLITCKSWRRLITCKSGRWLITGYSDIWLITGYWGSWLITGYSGIWLITGYSGIWFITGYWGSPSSRCSEQMSLVSHLHPLQKNMVHKPTAINNSSFQEGDWYMQNSQNLNKWKDDNHHLLIESLICKAAPCKLAC